MSRIRSERATCLLSNTRRCRWSGIPPAATSLDLYDKRVALQAVVGWSGWLSHRRAVRHSERCGESACGPRRSAPCHRRWCARLAGRTLRPSWGVGESSGSFRHWQGGDVRVGPPARVQSRAATYSSFSGPFDTAQPRFAPPQRQENSRISTRR